MTARDHALDVVRQLTSAGFIAYWAGGCVRDLLMGRRPDDYDVATNAHPQQVRELFGSRRTLAVGQSFGVIIVLGPRGSGLQVEVATFRTEGEYKDGRRPDSVAFCSPEEDAQRRDFTINGMFIDPLTDTVHDFVGGQEDLGRKVLRAIGNPFSRMAEDKLRMLRAVRFTAVLDFELDRETSSAISQMATQVVLVSAERIAQELRKMLAHRLRGNALRLLRDLRLMPVILPEVEECVHLHGEESWQRQLNLALLLGETSFEVTMAMLHDRVPSLPEKRGDPERHHGSVQSACRRLKLSNQELQRIVWLVEQKGLLDQVAEFSLAELKRLCLEPYLRDLLHLEQVTRTFDGRDLAQVLRIRNYLESTPTEVLNPRELLNGRDLIEMGFRPGRPFREWLEEIRTAQLNEEISSRDEALKLLEKIRTRN